MSNELVRQQCLRSQTCTSEKGERGRGKNGWYGGLCSAMSNKWVLSVNINTEIAYWQRPVPERGGCRGRRFQSQLFSLQTRRVAGRPPSCETAAAARPGVFIESVIKKQRLLSPTDAANLQLLHDGEKCWKTAAAR